jgi:hypothetical protein
MVGIERARQMVKARARKHTTSVDVQRLARIRTHGVKGMPRHHLSKEAAKYLEAKLERLRAKGSIKGVRRAKPAVQG